MTVPIRGSRAYAKQERMFLDVARFTRYFRDERGMTREQVLGIIERQINVTDGYRLYTDLNGVPLAKGDESAHGMTEVE